MIRHTILFKIKASATPEELNFAITNIYRLKNKLKGIISILAGECYFQDEKSTAFFSAAVSHGIFIDFDDQTALERFLKDPITHPAKESIVKIVEGGYDGIVGFDLADK